MRTYLDIDDSILQAAMLAGGYKTKKDAVEAGLRMLAQRSAAYRDLLRLAGKVDWDERYDYKAMREGHLEAHSPQTPYRPKRNP